MHLTQTTKKSSKHVFAQQKHHMQQTKKQLLNVYVQELK